MFFNPTAGRLIHSAAFFLFLAVSATAQENQLALESQQAKQLMSQGRFEEAIPLYRHLVNAVPGNPGLILNLGLAQEMAGHPADAVPQFETVLKAQPDNVPALTSLGMAQLQLNQPSRAIAPFQKLTAVQPDNRDARGMLAGALSAVGRSAEAAAQYRKLAAMDPSDAKAWYGLGKSYESLASDAFDRLEKIAPESPYVLELIGDSQVSRQQYRSAFFFYKQALEKMPSLRGVHSGLAEVYEKTGHSDWAAAERQQEQSLQPLNCQTQAAECMFDKGKLLEAAQAASKSPASLLWATKAYNGLALQSFDRLGALPESVEIHALKAEILRGHHQYLEEANEWRAALKIAPDDARLKHELLVSLFSAHDYQTVIAMLQTTANEHRNSPEDQFMLGTSLLRVQQPEKSLPYLQSALRERPDMQAADASLGMALALINRPADAIPHLEKALALDEDGSLHYQLARAFQAQGNTRRARELMVKYQQIQRQNQESKDEVAKEAQITAPVQK
jgi:tetratricopeptide (TPR) repeat protein